MGDYYETRRRTLIVKLINQQIGTPERDICIDGNTLNLVAYSKNRQYGPRHNWWIYGLKHYWKTVIQQKIDEYKNIE